MELILMNQKGSLPVPCGGVLTYPQGAQSAFEKLQLIFFCIGLIRGNAAEHRCGGGGRAVPEWNALCPIIHAESHLSQIIRNSDTVPDPGRKREIHGKIGTAMFEIHSHRGKRGAEAAVHDVRVE